MHDEEKPGEKPPTRAAAPSPQEVSDKLKGALDKLPELPEHVRVSVAEAMSFVGPLPPPTMYREYENALAGSAERILVMAEKEQNHRIAWETSERRRARGGNIGEAPMSRTPHGLQPHGETS